MDAIKKVEKSGNKILYCEICHYYAKRNDLLFKHFLTNKHIRNRLAIEKVKKGEKGDNCKYSCTNCSKEFLSNSGLWRHKKKCIIIIENNENKDNLEKNSILDICNNKLELSNELFIKLLNDNQEMRNVIIKQQEQISELIPKVGNNNTTQNNKFNIQVFLNEKCKDAINMTDFIKSIEVSLQQLDFTQQNGLANGLSKTIIDNMSKLSVFERPLHCTDVKRETLYIKDENEWSKDVSKEKIKKAIKKASNKNYNALQEWKTENPDYMQNDLKTDYFTNTIRTIGKTDNATEDKIIKKICKETYLK
jgi:hypothetical protein